MLLAAGCNPSKVSWEGESAISIAHSCGFFDIVRMLSSSARFCGRLFCCEYVFPPNKYGIRHFFPITSFPKSLLLLTVWSLTLFIASFLNSQGHQNLFHNFFNLTTSPLFLNHVLTTHLFNKVGTSPHTQLLYVRLLEPCCTFTLKMATALFAEM